MERLYIDMCCLKRPFDDQSQGRIWMESQAVVRILTACWIGLFEARSSPALLHENRLNPNQLRRMRVSEILSGFGAPPQPAPGVYRRATFLTRAGVDALDAVHLAFAEEMRADYFITCDDDLLRIAKRLKSRMAVIDPISFVKENNV